MMKYLCLFLLIFTASAAFSQVEKQDDRLIAAQFLKFHNANQVDSIYILFSDEMQQALPLAKAREFLLQLKVEAGAIEKMEFYKYDGPYASYKTTFEKGTFAVNIALGADKKIGGFFIKPMPDEPLPN
jgi:hypothetical protein